jgi:hypothetical protein|eukprot:SAG25_NODE_904_length_4830_cov_6.116254_5_plen_312_part_00
MPVLAVLVAVAAAADGTTAMARSPSGDGPPPRGRILPEGTPVAPRGLLQPVLNSSSSNRSSSSAVALTRSQHYWFDEPSPPVRDANGTFHLFATRRPMPQGGGVAAPPGSMAGAVIVHFESADGEPGSWRGGEVVLSPNASGWDNGAVFSPGAAFDAVNGTWAIFYSGLPAGKPAGEVPMSSIGLASSTLPSTGFVRAFGGKAVIVGGSGDGHTTPSGAQYVYTNGAIPAGGDLGFANTTVAAAELHCNLDPMCKGFTFHGPSKNPIGKTKIYFKRMDTVTDDSSWQSYTKQLAVASVPNASLRHPRPMWR